jgi:hypothetical protein
MRSPQNDFVMAEKSVGRGHLLVGGMTPDDFHSPVPNAANLTANIVSYAANLHHGATACVIADNLCVIGQCDGSGSCVQVSTASMGTQCGDGKVCDSNGNCIPDPG